MVDDRFSNAETDLMETPAPHKEAFLFKLEHLFGEEAIEKEDGELPLWDVKWVRLLMADARRLLRTTH